MTARLCDTCGKNLGSIYRITGGDRFTWTSAVFECRECVDKFDREQDEFLAGIRKRREERNYREWLGYDDKPSRRARKN